MEIPAIETPRLILRPFTSDDAEEYCAKIFADPDVMRYLPRRDVPPRTRAENAIRVFNQRWAEHGLGLWAVTDKASGALIGHGGLQDIPETEEVELSYALAKPYWGQGIATEVAEASVKFGFEEIGLERIIALAVPENIASRRVMEHVGMLYEKDARYFDMDVVYYAIERNRQQGQPQN